MRGKLKRQGSLHMSTFQNFGEPRQRGQVGAHPYELHFFRPRAVLQSTEIAHLRVVQDRHSAGSARCVAVFCICVIEAFCIMIPIGIEELQDGCKRGNSNTTANKNN
jgi:hypothetical protein